MLIVATGDDLRVALSEQGEARDLLADHVGRLDLDVVEVGRRGCLQSQQSYDPAAQDQEPLCPARMMGEERQVDLMHGEIAAPQRRLV